PVGSKSQGSARLFDPTGRPDLLEQIGGALDQATVHLLIVAAAKAAIGQERLRQLRAGLDFLQDVQTTAEGGLRFVPVAQCPMDFPEGSMDNSLLQLEPLLFRKFQCRAGCVQGLAGIAHCKMKLSESYPRKSDAVHAELAHCVKRRFRENSIKNSSRIAEFFQFQVAHDQPGG